MFIQYMLVPFAALLVLILFYVNIRSRYVSSTSSDMGRKAPLAAGALPIIGHLHKIMGGERLHQVLGRMADEYGSAFMIHICGQQQLVLSNWEFAKDCFTTNDKFLTKTPFNNAINYLTYNQPTGPYWMEMRKVARFNLLSNQRVQLQKQARESEFDAFFNELYQLCLASNNDKQTVLVEINKWFEELTLNVVTRMMSGKQNVASKARRGGYDEAMHYKTVIDDARCYARNRAFSDTYPILVFLDHLLGHERALKRTAKKLDSLLSTWVEEHKEKRVKGIFSGNNQDEEQDFIDLTLSMMEETRLNGLDSEILIKSLCVSTILASDTTCTTMSWILSLVLNNSEVLSKAKNELDQIVGDERKVEDSDILNLVYLRAIVKESMRLYPGLIISREVEEDCNIGGYSVKAGARVLVNVWKVQQDPRVWVDPSEFRPERFLTDNLGVDVRGRQFELIPFGSGRRMCPGVSFGLEVVHLALARLIHSFDLAIPESSSDANTNPLQVLLTPRLASKLYHY